MSRRKVRLSDLYVQIGKYLATNGDADVSSISTHCNSLDKIQYTLNLSDLSKEGFDKIGQIDIKYEEF